MEDLTWLSKLGPGGLLALGIGLLLLLLAYGLRLLMAGRLVPESTLRRERQISDQWRQAYLETVAAMDRQTEALRQLVAVVELRPGTGGRHRAVG